MAEQLESTLLQLLVPDNDVIKQATLNLKNMVNDVNFVPSLCKLLGSSPNAQVRQYAALLMRRKCLKKKDWNSLPQDLCQNIRDNLLQILLAESEKPVKKSIAQLIATIAKHELPNNRWPALFQFLQQYIQSDNAEYREVGSFLLSTVTSVAHEQLKPHMSSLLSLCSSMLSETVNHKVAFYTIQTLTNIVPSIGTDSQKQYESLIPKVVEVLRNLTAVDEDMAAEGLDILDELVECEVAILQPHIRLVIHFCVEMAQNVQLSSSIRTKALSFISAITKQKKKSISKLNLAEPILAVLFPIICDAKSDDEEDEAADAESSSPSAVACQVIDVMALHLPSEKFIPLLMKFVEPSLNSSEANVRRAGYIAIAVSAEGCADHIRTKLLESLLQQVYRGLSDLNADVRNAAMFALGQFAEHLQPDISKYSSELLPLLFACVSRLSSESSGRSRDIIRVYYAMETFCENLGKDILPYLPQLMEFLIGAINNAPKLEAKALAISAIGATANAAEDGILPYFQAIVDSLKHFLVATENEEQLKVQVQAIDTLGVLARILKENFRPLAADSLQLGITLMNNSTEPDLRRSVYGLFAAMSTLLKEEMGPYLEPVVQQLYTCIESTEGITAHYDDQDAQVLQIFSSSHDEIEMTQNGNDDDDEDDDCAVQGFTVSNSFIDEKQDALSTLGELSLMTGQAFAPYIANSFGAVTEMLAYPTSDIRRTAVIASGQICRAYWRLPTADRNIATTMLTTATAKMIEMAKLDDDRQVVITILECLKELLDEIKEPVLTCIGRPDIIVAVIRDAFHQKMACQDNDDEVDEGQAEFDSILIENAGELMPTLAKVLGGQTFAPYFAGLLPELMKRLRQSSKVPEKSFAVGTVAETLQAMGAATSSFVGPLLPVVMGTVCDEDDEVRSNSVFCLGIIAANGGTPVLQHYPNILKTLFDLLSKESNRRCVDNICAAACRMIMAQVNSVPVGQVFPVIIQYLPLKEDHEEDITVFRCVSFLFAQQQQLESSWQIMTHMPQLLVIAGELLASDPSADLRPVLSDLVCKVSAANPDVFVAALSLASPVSASSLQSCVNVDTCASL